MISKEQGKVPNNGDLSNGLQHAEYGQAGRSDLLAAGRLGLLLEPVAHFRP